MTIVVVAKSADELVMGCDSARSNQVYIMEDRKPKIIKHAEYLLGAAGSSRIIDLMHTYFRDIPRTREDPFEHTVEDIVPFVKDILFSHNALGTNDSEVEMNNNFLLCFENRIFNLTTDFAVTESYNDYHAIGSGSSFALGCLYTLSNKKFTPRYKVEQALNAATNFDYYCRGPYTYERQFSL